MYKYIFSDLDGTLLDDNKDVSSNNLQAIEFAQERGIQFILCSGRAPFFMEETLKKVKHYQDSNKLFIGFNGGVIVNGNMNIIDSFPMDPELAKKLFEYGTSDNKLCVVACFEDAYLRYNVNALGELADKWRWKESATIEEIMSLFGKKKCYKIFMASENHEYLEKTIKDIKEKVSIDLEFAYSNDNALEINPGGVTKGTAIKKLLKLINGNIEETIGIGDNINDLDMIKVCKLGCCPSNANQIVKENADYICNNDNNNDAVAEMIYKFIDK